MLIVLTLAWAYVSFGSAPESSWLLYGIKPIVIAIVAQALIGLGRTALRSVLPLIIMQYVVLFPLILQIQAALGFLGLGVQPPMPDWGAILQQGKDAILFAPWLSIFPGLTILTTSLGLSLIGQSLQGRIDRR